MPTYTIRLILALAANRWWEVNHLDVKTVFLSEELEEEVYVAQHEGYVEKGKERMVLKLSKALYGFEIGTKSLEYEAWQNSKNAWVQQMC